MTQPEPSTMEHEPRGVPASSALGTSYPTWRYLGDRAAADLAYCARFAVLEAPEPLLAPSSVWIYALPVVEPA